MQLRNIAIIAHVDHGKTTLVDRLLQQSGAFRENQRVAERVMDSNDLEKERGITIMAKATSIAWKETRINIVDTPGHADFGGEVERILSMVDGAIVLVDASEGPMPQTKFVVGKALKIGLRPIVAVNKVDKPDARITEVVNEVFDLFAALDASDEQLDFPILYGSAKQGWMADSPDGPKDGMGPLFDLVLKHVPPPQVEEGGFRMLGTLLEANPYLGRLITGRVFAGSIKPNQAVKVLDRKGNVVEQGRVSKILAFRGIDRTPIDEAEAGDIVAIAGLEKFNVADTLCAPEVVEPLQAQPIDPPTLSMTFLVNDSPLAGTEGDKVTSRVIRDRLYKEAQGNVALKIEESAGSDSYIVSGRGELQLAILIETMRREGFELGVSRPKVVFQKSEDGKQMLEPIEEVVIDVDEEHSGVVVQKMAERKAEMIEMRPSGGNRLRLVFHAPTRGLIGYQGELLTDTRGTAIMNRLFHEYAPWKGEIAGRRNGVLISNDNGESVAYAMWKLEDRGPMMIEPGWKVYRGMIVGEHTRENDLEINVLKGKQLTNIRAAGKDEAVRLTPPIRMTLERALAYIEDDELVEVTPKSIRLRKTYLDPNERKRVFRAKESA
ncbi:translational GTPase TypA [Methylocapsa palsarum]|uniref:Large ribosomal subunit assembly factor BipA n=1 Tax=Methylocapsa palsarum TaxID=1612308 RepID=A0A1I4BDY7_9HYPH|nr:translational GTPase TypA [Methylocapsa palsarum]SFK67008.1 GTP-binding protein [Methylocapsa palsarum]